MIMKTDLISSSDDDYETRRGEFLYCEECDSRCSATQGDYWNIPGDTPFRCLICNELLVLAREVCITKIVKR